MRKPVVLITGASGEIGHGLIDAPRRERPPPHRHPRPHAARAVAGAAGPARVHRLDPRPACSNASSPSSRSISSSTWRRCLSTRSRVHADHRAPGQRRGHAEPARVRPEGGRVARPAGRLPLPVVDRRLRAARPGDARRHAGRVQRGRLEQPTTMYGCNKLYCEQLGRYYARHYKQLAAEPLPGRVDFRCVRFPGPDLGGHGAVRRHVGLRPGDDPRGGQGEPYACFVRPDTRIPFMAMPDGVEALFGLAAAPRDRADADGLQHRAPSTRRPRRFAAAVLEALSRAQAHLRGRREAPGHRRHLAGRRGRLAGAPRLGLRAAIRLRARVPEYLIPTIRRRYE